MQKPKYQIGDKVWRIYDAKAKEETIYGAVALKQGLGYYFEEEESIGNVESYKWFDENKLFPSKEELIKSL